MGLLSIFKRKSQTAARGPAAASESPADAVQHARERARRRLVGAVLLLGVGIIGFPLLFETQPRPIPVDIPIEIPRKDSAAPLSVPAEPRNAASAHAGQGSGGAVITETAAEAGRELTPSTTTSAPATSGAPPLAARAPAPVAASKPATAQPDSAREPTKTAASHDAPVAGPAAKAPAAKAVERKVQEPRAVEVEGAKGRVVIQVGAFGEAAAVREARAKVEKLGLKTYTQVIETSAGKRTRVRVGPFATRDEAEKAAARIKSAGLQAALLTL